MLPWCGFPKGLVSPSPASASGGRPENILNLTIIPKPEKLDVVDN
jgi:hypothetical protein